MGNKSGSEFGGIMIRTEKSLYFAGDVVKGKIKQKFRKYIPSYNKTRISWKCCSIFNSWERKNSMDNWFW